MLNGSWAGDVDRVGWITDLFRWMRKPADQSLVWPVYITKCKKVMGLKFEILIDKADSFKDGGLLQLNKGTIDITLSFN